MMDEPINNQAESVKLIKNSRGYNWEIKLIGAPILADEDIKRLAQLDAHFRRVYGVGQGDTGKKKRNGETSVADGEGGTGRNDNLNKLKDKSDPGSEGLKTLQC
ncbi:hypothetical protein LCGC14_1874000 [marine sediment metagenome]|uniref:Uncharacterized protein n=1 Tax=marine sediment metagenome TaxID=412755 RepID=A0A0F9G444_9ZZZZ